MFVFFKSTETQGGEIIDSYIVRDTQAEVDALFQACLSEDDLYAAGTANILSSTEDWMPDAPRKMRCGDLMHFNDPAAIWAIGAATEAKYFR